MSVTNFPNGVSSFGLPVIPGSQVPPTMGQYWFVDSGAGNDTNDGLSINSEKATIGAAISASNAAVGNNDGTVVLVDAGHAESVNKAAYLTISQSGLYFIGMGTGASRPTFTWNTTTAAQIIISGNNITFDNFVFDFTGIDAVVAAFSITGSDCVFVNCTFLTNSATAGVVKGILTSSTATRFRVENCLFYGAQTNSGTTTTAFIDYEGGADILIKNNYFTGKTVNGILNTNTVLRGLIDNNRFLLYTGTQAIVVSSTSTMYVTNNRFSVSSGTTVVVAATGFALSNTLANTTGSIASATTF